MSKKASTAHQLYDDDRRAQDALAGLGGPTTLAGQKDLPKGDREAWATAGHPRTARGRPGTDKALMNPPPTLDDARRALQALREGSQDPAERKRLAMVVAKLAVRSVHNQHVLASQLVEFRGVALSKKLDE